MNSTSCGTRLSLALLVNLLAFTGCQQKSATTNTPETAAISPIAVIDLDRLASEIGANNKIRSALEATERDVLANLVTQHADWLEQPVPTIAEFNAAAARHLDSLPSEKRKQLIEQTQTAQSKLLQRQLELRDSFYAEISPVAYEIARERGFQMVLTTGQVYAAGSELDITSAVADRIQKINESAVRTSDASSATHRALPQAGGGSFRMQ